ncbi:MAG: PAS domain-containing protein, partial [Alphaproteobacteria bacterium]|nr:PAS domain-containing protein [Alphaproteobacteria bacterium]
MLQVARNALELAPAAADRGDYGVWTGYRIPEDRSSWHPLVRALYDYWRSVSPPDRLPGRQHIAPEAVPALWSRLWMLDVYRDPLRYRYRLCGTEVVRSLGREMTGQWL